MSTTIATYYSDELITLDEATGFYTDEILELETRLTDLIHRDSIPHLATTAEHFLDQLSKQQQHFLMLQKDIAEQQNKLKQNDGFIPNSNFSPEITANQDSLRKKMFGAEKEYLDVKYGCLDFLSGTISHQV